VNTADAVAKEIERLNKQVKAGKMSYTDAIWDAGKLCIGWPYVYGRYGEYCEPANRARAKEKCQVLNGSKATCSGCKWYPNGKRVRCFDCRGFTGWVLKQFGINLHGGGCTSQWNTESNWKAKGNIKIDGIPDNTLVCLFYPDKREPKKMAHTGFGLHGAVLDCSTGVTLYEKRTSIWTNWAIPNGIGGDIPDFKPTIRKGDKGEYVKILQTQLVKRGYDIGKAGIDSNFGSGTEKAVKSFQKDHPPLIVDGIVGKLTWEALDEDPDPQLYTVHVPMLPLFKAEALVSQYSGAWMTKEGGDT